MKTYLTKELTQRAVELHDSVNNWNIVASVLKTNTTQIRRSIKHYYEHNK